MKKIKIVYFIYLRPNYWQKIFIEQFDNLKSCGLYDKTDEIYISVIDEYDEFKELKKIIKKDYPKVRLKNVFKKNYFEYGGFKTLMEVTDENCIILYFHSKGMFSETIENNVNKIRKILFDNTIKNFNFFIDNFQNRPNLNLGGLFINKNGFVYYNFFWINGEFIKNKIPTPKINEDRFVWETWLKNYFQKNEEKNFISPYDYTKFENKTQVKKIMKKFVADKI